MNQEEVVKELVTVISSMKGQIPVPIGISNRHIHLSQYDFELLFPNESIEIFKELTQPGFYAAKQTVTLSGPKGELKNVRLLGPLRSKTQVEISQTDARRIGVLAPIRLSGQLSDATEITISTDSNTIVRPAAIIAKRHIHMNPVDAMILGFKEGDEVAVRIESESRTTIFENVSIRPSQGAILEMHLDTDEANAASCGPNSRAYFI